MEILQLIIEKMDLFLIVLARVTGLFQMAPIFSGQRTPMYVRMGFSLLITMLIVFVFPKPDISLPQELIPFILGMAGEFILGFLIGFVVHLVFITVQVAGQFIDMQMGFAIVNVMDPQSGIQMPLIGNYLYTIALLVFLALDGHHLLLSALVHSYDFIPIFGFAITGELANAILLFFCGVFITALKIAVPIVGTLLITDISIGLVARTVPQMNVFIVGLPLKIFVGLLLLFVVVPIYVMMMNRVIMQGFDYVDQLLRVLAP